MLYIQALMKDQNTETDYSKYELKSINILEELSEEVNKELKQVNKEKDNFNNKNKLNSRNKKIINKNKNKALLNAQDVLLNLCKPDKKLIEKEILNMKYILNWSGLKVNSNFEDDEIKVIENEKEFIFSKKKFFSNKFFKKKLSEIYSKELGFDVWVKVKFFQDDNYLVKILRKN